MIFTKVPLRKQHRTGLAKIIANMFMLKGSMKYNEIERLLFENKIRKSTELKQYVLEACYLDEKTKMLKVKPEFNNFCEP